MPRQPLATALEVAAASVPAATLAREVARLAEDYRGGVATGGPGAIGRERAVAYAVYRMPATYAAAHAACTALAATAPAWAPRRLLDLGAGCGAVGWAAADVFPTLASMTYVERDTTMTALGRELASLSPAAAIREARWVNADLADLPGLAELPDSAPIDLAVAAYALGELSSGTAAGLVDRLAASAETVLLIEPGTPRGYAAVLAARDRLIASGLTVAAPCPHSRHCPMSAPESPDWCHFAVRLSRSPAHRQAKGAALGYEDEKFSYVAATRRAPVPVPARVVRHPQRRSGHVHLDLCTRASGLERATVSRRSGEAYRAARDVAWGDGWDRGEAH